jgi:hypothetical protein
VLIVWPWEFVHFVKSEYTWRASSVVLLWGFPGFEDAIDGGRSTRGFRLHPPRIVESCWQWRHQGE